MALAIAPTVRLNFDPTEHTKTSACSKVCLNIKLQALSSAYLCLYLEKVKMEMKKRHSSGSIEIITQWPTPNENIERFLVISSTRKG